MIFKSFKLADLFNGTTEDQISRQILKVNIGISDFNQLLEIEKGADFIAELLAKFPGLESVMPTTNKLDRDFHYWDSTNRKWVTASENYLYYD